MRRFEQKIESGLTAMAARCEKQQRFPRQVEREVGRMLGQNTRAARLFEVTVGTNDKGRARVTWKKIESAALGPRSAPAAICCGPMCSTGPTKNSGRRTCN